MKKSLLILLIGLCCLSSWAQSNIVRTVPFVTNYSITYFPKDAGVVIDIPNYKSKLKLPKSLSFNEVQKWDIERLLEKYFSYSRALEENEMKFFSKSLGSIPEPHDGLKWATGLNATVYVSQEGKALLVLESKSKPMESTDVIVLDWDEVRHVVEFIKMIPDMKKEAERAAK